jgi:hypothetical protein
MVAGMQKLELIARDCMPQHGWDGGRLIGYDMLEIFLKSEACMPLVYSFPQSTHVKWQTTPWYYRAYQDYVL